jgi:tetratricopeptide (TPR) repeat protein
MKNIDEHILQAKLNFQSGDYKNAIRGFLEAQEYFLNSNNEIMAAEMANNLSVAYLQDGQKKNALEIVEGTNLIFEQAGDTLRQALALGNLAAALEAMKRFPEAEDAYQKSAELFGQCNEKEYQSTVLKSLSALHIRQGKQLKSIFSMQQSLEHQPKPSLKDRLLKHFLKLPFKFLGK